MVKRRFEVGLGLSAPEDLHSRVDSHENDKNYARTLTIMVKKCFLKKAATLTHLLDQSL